MAQKTLRKSETQGIQAFKGSRELRALEIRVVKAIQDFGTIVSSEISLEMESLNMCKESLISMVIQTFDRLRSGLNSFHGELLLVGHHTKGGEHM